MSIFFVDIHVPLLFPCGFDELLHIASGKMVWNAQVSGFQSLGDGFEYFSAKEDSGHGKGEEIIVAQL